MVSLKKETIRDERSFEYFGPLSNVKLQQLLFPFSPFSRRIIDIIIRMRAWSVRYFVGRNELCY